MITEEDLAQRYADLLEDVWKMLKEVDDRGVCAETIVLHFRDTVAFIAMHYASVRITPTMKAVLSQWWSGGEKKKRRRKR